MRIGIIGCGLIAELHMDALEQMSEIVEIVAFCDIREERAEKFAALHKETTGKTAAVYTEYQQMLEESSLDAVHLCTPHHLHVAMAQFAADKGVAVFTEKPPVITWEGWEAFYQLKDKVPVGVCFQNRYNPCNRLLTEIAHSPAAGKVLGGRAFVTWFRDESYYKSADWRGKIATEGGGVLINQAIHTLDLLIQCTGRPNAIEANASNYHLKDTIEVEDTVDAYMSFAHGGVAMFYATTAYCCNAPIMVEIRCENVTIRAEDGIVYCTWNNGKEETITPAPLAVETLGGRDYWGNAHAICIRDFYESILEKRPYQNDIESVKATMEATLGIYQSARENIVVTL